MNATRFLILTEKAQYVSAGWNTESVQAHYEEYFGGKPFAITEYFEAPSWLTLKEWEQVANIFPQHDLAKTVILLADNIKP